MASLNDQSAIQVFVCSMKSGGNGNLAVHVPELDVASLGKLYRALNRLVVIFGFNDLDIRKVSVLADKVRAIAWHEFPLNDEPARQSLRQIRITMSNADVGAS
jgi:hypothetical protein